MLLLLPLVYKTWKRIGFAIFFIVLFIPRMLSLEFTVLRWYSVAAVLGIIFSERDLFVKLHQLGDSEKRIKRGLWGAMKICAGLLAGVVISIYRAKWGILLELSDALLAILVIYLSWEILRKVVVVKKGFAFLGKYSMNMFLVHTFFKAHFFGKYMYYFENAWMNILVLLATTLLFSVGIELLKKLIHMEKITDKMIRLVLAKDEEKV